MRRFMFIFLATSLVFLSQITSSYAFPLVSDPSLVGYWKLDTQTGNYTPDSSISGYNGRVIGDTTLDSAGGVYGGAYNLDGSGDRIQIKRSDYEGLSRLLPTTNQITVSTWFKVAGDSSSWCQHPVSKWDNYHLRFSDDLTSLIFTVFTGHHNEHAVAFSNPNGVLELNAWYHAVGTYDGTTSRLYLNGNEVASRELGITMYAADNYDLLLGSVGWTNDYEQLNGSVDEVAIWNRALSGDEIKQLYDIPEPSALSLLALGSLSLLHHRRKG